MEVSPEVVSAVPLAPKGLTAAGRGIIASAEARQLIQEADPLSRGVSG
jgi:hypothetical protein